MVSLKDCLLNNSANPHSMMRGCFGLSAVGIIHDDLPRTGRGAPRRPRGHAQTRARLHRRSRRTDCTSERRLHKIAPLSSGLVRGATAPRRGWVARVLGRPAKRPDSAPCMMAAGGPVTLFNTELVFQPELVRGVMGFEKGVGSIVGGWREIVRAGYGVTWDLLRRERRAVNWRAGQHVCEKYGFRV